jgi:hypothetical protein
MEVNRNISSYVIKRGKTILIDILSTGNIDNYPIDWTQSNDLPLPSGVTLTVDSDFSNLGTNYAYMTHIVPTGATTVNSTVLKQINSLNAIWKQLNLIKIGIAEEGIGKRFILHNYRHNSVFYNDRRYERDKY